MSFPEDDSAQNIITVSLLLLLFCPAVRTLKAEALQSLITAAKKTATLLASWTCD